MRRWVPLVVLAVLATACGYDGASSLPLPGAIGGKDTYPVTVVLDDATNLVAKETCRANSTVVGSVESVTLDRDLRARVVCRIKDSVDLPANSVATLSETSLLGERFLEIGPPAGQTPVGVLAHGATLPASSTRADPDVETVFGALSQVLNGGSLGSIETITRELDTAFAGSDVHGSLQVISKVVSTLDDHRSQIAQSLVSLDRLAGRLARQKQVLAQALDAIPGGLAVLDRQRARLVRTLRKLSDLSSVAVPLIRSSRASTVADLKHLAPVLAQVSKAGDELALTVERVLTFPFPANGLSTIKGDFAGFYGTAEIDVDALNRLLGTTDQPPIGSSSASPGSPREPATTPGNPLVQLLTPTTTGLTGLLNSLLGGSR